MNYDECDYEGCHNSLSGGWQPDNGAKLCEEHAEEFNEIAEAEDPERFVSFAMKTLKQGKKRLS